MNDQYKGDRFVYFDLETIPSQSPEYLKRCLEKVKPPASIKKPSSVKKWYEESAEGAAQDLFGKSSFDGGRGHICTIAWAKNDDEIKCFHAATSRKKSHCWPRFLMTSIHTIPKPSSVTTSSGSTLGFCANAQSRWASNCLGEQHSRAIRNPGTKTSEIR